MAKEKQIDTLVYELYGLTEKEAKAKADEIRAGNATVSVGDIFGDKEEL